MWYLRFCNLPLVTILSLGFVLVYIDSKQLDFCEYGFFLDIFSALFSLIYYSSHFRYFNAYIIYFNTRNIYIYIIYSDPIISNVNVAWRFTGAILI